MTAPSWLDALRVGNSYADLGPQYSSRVQPRPLTAPRLLHANPQAAALLGLDSTALGDPAFLALCAGQEGLPGGQSLAAVYSGHQFGVWAGQLGDGRAHLLGEIQGPEGPWEVQLKGSGLTPYSRMGDGRAVLRSSVREYLASEAMVGLGIPTTRALALVVSDDPVYRETVETAAIVTRLAPSFVRFGSFEHWFAAGDVAAGRRLLDYVVDRFYPACRIQAEGDADRCVALFFDAVAQRTAALMAAWQSVGFCHGVMNTDNMSILGLTLDYGPYGFMDGFDAGHICNHTDQNGRYAWYQQPGVGYWNLSRLAAALRPLVSDGAGLDAALERYESAFIQAWHARLAAKLGLENWQASDEALADDLLRLMHESRADFTLTFRALAQALRGEPAAFLDRFIDRETARAWLDRHGARVAAEGSPVRDSTPQDNAQWESAQQKSARRMDAVNPRYVLRNWMAEQAIVAAKAGDASEIERLLTILRDPYREHPGAEAYAAAPPDWSQDLSVSCSS